MAFKEITRTEKVEVCDLCGGQINKGCTDQESGKRFDTVGCMYFAKFKTKEAWATDRKEKLREQGFQV